MSNYLLKYGTKTLILPVILILIGIYFKNLYIIVIAFFILLFLYNFYKVPIINVLTDTRVITAPTFGRVQKVDRINNNIYISIFLSPFDPHIQYMPYNGYLVDTIYKTGTFKPAFLFKKSIHNERMIYNIQTNLGMISVVQIAGIMARRISSFVIPNNKYLKGHEIGMIHFGSRVDIIIPYMPGMKIYVKKGTYVKGPETPLIQL